MFKNTKVKALGCRRIPSAGTGFSQGKEKWRMHPSFHEGGTGPHIKPYVAAGFAPGQAYEGKEFHIVTSAYAAVLHPHTLSLSALGAHPAPLSAAEAALFLPEGLPEVAIEYSLHLHNTVYLPKSGVKRGEDVGQNLFGNACCQILLPAAGLESEAGRHLALPASVQVFAQPAFISSFFEIRPESEIEVGFLTARLTLPGLVKTEEEGGLLKISFGSGHRMLLSCFGEAEQFGNSVVVRVPCSYTPAGSAVRVGFAFMPYAEDLGKSISFRMFSAPPLAYCAQAAALRAGQGRYPAVFNKEEMAYEIAAALEDGLQITVENPYNEPVCLPLQLALRAPGWRGQGISFVREESAAPPPIGLCAVRRKEGVRLCAFIQAELGPRETARFVLQKAGQESSVHYTAGGAVLSAAGGMPAWRADKDFTHCRSFFTGLRVLDAGEKGQAWQGEAGGLDAFVAQNQQGERVRITGVRTFFESHGPLQAETRFTGWLEDGGAEVTLCAVTPPPHDAFRHLFLLEMRVRKPCRYARFHLFEMGAAKADGTGAGRACLGAPEQYEEVVSAGGGEKYIKAPAAVAGLPFISLTGARLNGQGAPAQRVLAVRAYESRLLGRQRPAYLGLWGTEDGFPGIGGVVSLPAGEMLPGDFIRACIEVILLPQMEEDYFGPSQSLKQALGKGADSIKMALREVQGNALRATCSAGRLQSVRPLHVLAENNRADLHTWGGIGFASLRFSGLAPGAYRLTVYRGGEQKTYPSAGAQSFEDGHGFGLLFAADFTDSTEGRGERRIVLEKA